MCTSLVWKVQRKMTDPYQLWGVQAPRKTIAMLGDYKTLRRLKTAWRRYVEKGMATNLEARLYTTGKGYTVINDQMDVVELREFSSSIARDQDILRNATHFTIVAFLGTGRYERHKRDTLEEARQLGEELARERKKNYMIYAVNSRGNSAYVEYIKGV